MAISHIGSLTGSNQPVGGKFPQHVLVVDAAGNALGIGGTPVSLEAAYTAAQTNTAIVTVSAGEYLDVVSIEAIASAVTSVTVGFRIGFHASTTPTTTGVVLSHPGILALSGSGIGKGTGAGVIGRGADGEDLRITSDVPTDGSLRVVVTYYVRTS
jgi:hypothetical protein